MHMKQKIQIFIGVLFIIFYIVWNIIMPMNNLFGYLLHFLLLWFFVGNFILLQGKLRKIWTGVMVVFVWYLFWYNFSFSFVSASMSLPISEKVIKTHECDIKKCSDDELDLYIEEMLNNGDELWKLKNVHIDEKNKKKLSSLSSEILFQRWILSEYRKNWEKQETTLFFQNTQFQEYKNAYYRAYYQGITPDFLGVNQVNFVNLLLSKQYLYHSYLLSDDIIQKHKKLFDDMVKKFNQ